MSDQPDGLDHLRWPHSGRTGALNVAASCETMNTIPAGQRGRGQVADVPVDLYGSEGWRFEKTGNVLLVLTGSSQVVEPHTLRLRAPHTQVAD